MKYIKTLKREPIQLTDRKTQRIITAAKVIFCMPTENKMYTANTQINENKVTPNITEL